MAYELGEYVFSRKGDLHWLDRIFLDKPSPDPVVRIKYITEVRGVWGEQPGFNELPLQNIKQTPELRYVGRITLLGRKEEPLATTIAFNSLRRGILSVMTKTGLWVESESFIPKPKPKTLRVGSANLQSCCIDSLDKMNIAVSAQYQLDFVSLVGDLAGILDSAEALAKALNAAIQKAASNNATSPSVMMSGAVRRKILELASIERNQHVGKEKEFWDAVAKSWGEGH